uniref:Phospholipid scramblase n=1 Tax=Ciona intestinalis TaxID=7719 RepID=H2XKN9_CIOIN|nr:phospholipid scramblase 1-like [Ciona intestinalis]|eukprot:XP_004226230.1 phospholipid scramblase 1-like [Ciona intestinalis]
MSLAVTSQPHAIVREKHLSENVWIRKPKPGQHVLEKMSDLSDARHLHVHRNVKGTICSGKQDYDITDQDGKLMYKAVEDSHCCCVHCCGPARAYKIIVKDPLGLELLQFHRPVRCSDTCLCCCGCGLMRMRVTEACSDVVIGDVKQRCTFIREKFDVTELVENEQTTLIGPSVTCRCFANMTFQIIDDKNSEVGEIWKRWKGAPNEN